MYQPNPDQQPKFVKEYLATFKALYPDAEPPTVWERFNGWVAFRSSGTSFERSMRKQQIVAMTARLNQRKTKND